MPLRFITSPDELHRNIDSFIAAIHANPETARDVLRRARYIVCRRSPLVVGAPSKFVAYENMSGERYPTAGSEPGVPFNGTRARVAIELVLGGEFGDDERLREAFASWADEELPGVRDGIDSEKWCFIVVPPLSTAAASVAGPPEPRMDNWPSYAASRQAYANSWYAYNDELYALVARRRGHAVLADVVAKVGILARAYATQLERHASGDGDGAILDVAGALHAVGAEFDAKIEALRPRAGRPGGLDLETLAEVVRLHGWVSEHVSRVLRDEHASPSFVSKYLHFHLPAAPIYDSRARVVINGFYPAYGNRNRHLPRIRGADPAYFDFCNRFWSLWSEALRDHLVPDTKQLDQYLLYCHATRAWDG